MPVRTVCLLPYKCSKSKTSPEAGLSKMISFCCRSSTSAALAAGFPFSGGIKDYLRQDQALEEGFPVSLVLGGALSASLVHSLVA